MDKYLQYFNKSIFSFDGDRNVIADQHLGIAADVASLLTPYSTVAKLTTFQGCPYTCTSFSLDVRIDGEQVKTRHWQWLPNAILRVGETENFRLETVTAVVPGGRSVVQKLTVTGLKPQPQQVPLAIQYRGLARYHDEWRFPSPKGEPCSKSDYRVAGEILTGEFADAALHITCSLEGMKLFPRAFLWENQLTIPAGGSVSFYLSAHMGEKEKSLQEAQKWKGKYEEMLDASFAYLEQETDRIQKNLPQLKTDCPDLDRLYYRSLVTYILCRWENPDLCTVPYYSTGSINGACMCSYLWDYCGGLMLHPIYDPEGNKKQLLGYLRNDLTRSYALNPANGGPVGPWYQINQEKIILMVYHHIRATGEIEFLQERVGDKTVLEWMRYHAYVCDDVTKPVELYDYGVGGDDHLELKRWGNGPYNGVIPDLNARRYQNYMLVYELTCLAGQPDELLPRRAAQLKEAMKALWNEKAGWYDFIDADGNRDIRYTVQMFKFLTSNVIDGKEREALIHHLNEREFLSKFGLHSMSKLDTQYDQDDIDNGGGGICTHFTLHICLQLYQMGYDTLASDILRRIYWWGERLPYMGDSCASNMILNREDTPLQGDISSTACAQTIFFGIFGITPGFDGSIRICPVKNRPARNMRIDNARLCGKVFSVAITGDTYQVTTPETTYRAPIGETVTI